MSAITPVSHLPIPLFTLETIPRYYWSAVCKKVTGLKMTAAVVTMETPSLYLYDRTQCQLVGKTLMLAALLLRFLYRWAGYNLLLVGCIYLCPIDSVNVCASKTKTHILRHATNFNFNHTIICASFRDWLKPFTDTDVCSLPAETLFYNLSGIPSTWISGVWSIFFLLDIFPIEEMLYGMHGNQNDLIKNRER